MDHKTVQREKAILFHALHQAEQPLILPNIWDVLGAKLLGDVGYPAVATASAAIAYTHGYPDGEHFPFDELVVLLKKINDSSGLPVTADIESGYADNDTKLQENIERLLGTGIVGINIEDTHRRKNTLYHLDDQCRRIQIIRRVADQFHLPLFINARTDIMLYPSLFSSEDQQTEELLRRGKAYQDAGADGLYPITLRKKAIIEQIVRQIELPINLLTLSGIPDLITLENMGVKRISLGPAFLKIAIQSMKNLALSLQRSDGLSAITENPITSDYLTGLVSQKK